MTEGAPFGWTRPARIAREIATRLLRERTTPARLGWAVAVGVLIGTTPFYGMHLAMTFTVATLLGLNRAITYLAANVSLPVIAPFLAVGSIQIGTLLLTGSTLPLSIAGIQELGPWQFGRAWLLGALVLGAALGAPAGLATFLIMRAYRRRHPLPADPIAELFARTTARYTSASRFDRRYVAGKLAHDPVFRQLIAEGTLPAPVVDVGCGRGQTLLLLAESVPGVDGIGLDWDDRKLATARAAATALPRLRFERHDVRASDYPEAGTILLVDVLHYNPPEIQDRMLIRAARALRPDGVLYVRDIDAAAGWRSIVNQWQERIGCAVGLNRGATLCFRPMSEVRAVLEAEGLRVDVVPSAQRLSLANVLLVARRV